MRPSQITSAAGIHDNLQDLGGEQDAERKSSILKRYASLEVSSRQAKELQL